VRSRENRERGSSAVESGLTLAGVAVFLTPLLFYMGWQVRQALNAPCDASSVACADVAASSATGGGGGGGTGGGGTGGGGTGGGGTGGGTGGSGPGSGGSGPGPGPSDPTVVLQGRVVTMLGAASAVCDGQTTLTPPRNTRAICTVTFPDGQTRDYRVRWTDNSGSIRLTAR
jgi:hypothetical protein